MAETTPDHKFTFTHVQRTSLYSLSATTPRKRMGGWVLKLMAGLIITLLSLLSIQTISKPALAGKLTTPVPSQPTPLKKTVLALFPYQSDLPISMLATQAIHDELGKATDLELDVYYEYLDFNRFPGSDYQQKLLGLFSEKYRNKPVDLVILSSEVLLNLWLDKRAEILPNTPVVFYNIAVDRITGRQFPANVTGTSALQDHIPSIKWILSARPKVNEIIVIHGVGSADREYVQPVEIFKNELGDQVTFTDLSDQPLAEIKRRVAALPPTSVVLYEVMFEDAAGTKVRPINVLKELTVVSPVPILSGYDQFIGTGTIGGYMYSIDQQARDATQISLRILRGEAANSIPVANNQSNRFIFDHIALQHFDIPLSTLPPSSIIKNRQYSVWEVYQAEIISVAAGFVVLLLLVAFLLILTQRLNTSRLALTKLNAVLETRVQERTFTLSQTNHDLELEITERKRIEDALVKTNLELKLAFSERDNLVKDLRDNHFALELHNGKLLRTQAELGSVRDRYVDLYDLAPVGYCTVNENGLIREINLTAVTLLDFSRSQLINRPFTWFIFQKHKDNFYLAKEKLIATQKPQGSDLQMVKNDGSLFWAHLQITLEQLSDSSPVIRVMISDITERKRVEEALRESEERFRMMFENHHAVMLLIEPGTGQILDANQSAAKFYGYSLTSLKNMFITEINVVSPDEVKIELQKAEQRVLNYFVFPHRLANGDIRIVEIYSSPLKLHGKTALFSIMHDITQRKQIEEALQDSYDLLEQRVQQRTTELSAANLDLEKAARIKDEFLAAMSHELRTPLTGILGLSEVMQMQSPGHDPLTEKQRTHLTLIHNSGQHLLEMVNDILDFSSMGVGKFILNLAPCSLEEICQDCLRKGLAQSASKGLRSSFSMTPESILLKADARRLYQILSNLQSNAIKFTPKGGSFGIEVLGDPSEKQVHITVWDTGIGIQEEDIARLFQPFTQLDASLARKFNGTGLGLALVRKLTELHGGSVSVESKFGIGSRFTVRLPWRPS